MFEVQKYLRSGKTLEDLKEEYSIRANIDGDLVSLKYDFIGADMSLPICRECRGLVLEMNTWNVISRSFEKFFNYGEGKAAKLDFRHCTATEKIDGAMIQLYFRNGEWCVATSGTPKGDGNVNGLEISFREFFWKITEKLGFDVYSELDPYLFYTLELTAPEVIQVVQHKDYGLSWLASWEAKDPYSELSIWNLPNLTIPKVEIIQVEPVDLLGYGVTEADIKKLSEEEKEQMRFLFTVGKIVNSRNASEFEGAVICDQNFNRLKFKSDAYIAAHAIRSSAENSLKSVISLILEEKIDDVYPTMPLFVRERIDEIQKHMRDIINDINSAYNKCNKNGTQKEFALDAIKYDFKGILFAMFKTNISAIDALKLSTGSYIVDLVKNRLGGTKHG